ncbi:MAG: flagellar biosynthesis protein FliR [Robiginitomaculum sp.]|nr:MAG: flagellar biosynthesis protein FliR [Robiginitomaculum sp.]
MEGLETLSEYIFANFNIVYPLMAVFTRMSVFVFLLPGLGEQAISTRIRLVVALMLTWLITPVLDINIGNDWSVTTLALAIGLEAFYGFVLGFAFRMMVFALQIAGSITSQSMSLSQVFGGGMTTEPNTTISTMLMMAGITLLVTLDLHVRAVGMLVNTFETFPLASSPDTGKIAFWATEKTMSVFSFAVALALPFLLLSFVYNLMLGFLNKAMPQLMVSFVGMPFITGAGIVLLAITISGMLVVWLREFDAHLLGF